MELCLLARGETLQLLPPQQCQLLLCHVRSVVKLLVVGDVDRAPVVGVAQDVRQVGAHFKLQFLVGVPGVLRPKIL